MDQIDLKHFSYRNLKSLSIKDKEDLACKIREEIIKDVLKNGGHLSSNLGVVELTIELLASFDITKDNILFDVSHQTYTFKILTDRDLALIRLKDGLSGFSSREESKFDKVNGGHSGTCLSIASGIATAKKLNGDNSSTIVVIGDSSISNGVSFEALNTINEANYGKLIIVLNDNNMSISKPKGGLSKILSKLKNSYFYQNGAYNFRKIFNRKGLRWFYKGATKTKNVIKRAFLGSNIFESFNYVYLGPLDGHNYKKLSKAFFQAKRIDKSVFIHVKTIKGKGYKLAQEDDIGYYHGVSGENSSKGDYLTSYSSKAIFNKLKDDPKAILICPAMILGSKLEECFKTYPTRCFDTGISEEHCVDLACGFAIYGYHPILVIYSCFMQRSYDQLLADISLNKQSVLIVVERSGLNGQDGPSHQGIFDVGMETSLPNSIIYQPNDQISLYNAIYNYDFKSNGPYFVRIERQKVEKEEIKDTKLVPYTITNNSSNSLLIVVGIKGNILASYFKDKLDILYLKQIKPIDNKLIDTICSYKNVYLYDYLDCTFKEYFSYLLLANNFKGNVKFFTLEKKFILGMKVEEQLEDNNLTPKQVKEVLNKLLDETKS